MFSVENLENIFIKKREKTNLNPRTQRQSLLTLLVDAVVCCPDLNIQLPGMLATDCS